MQANFIQAFNVLQERDLNMEYIPTPTDQHANSVMNESIIKSLQNIQAKVDNITKENQNLKRTIHLQLILTLTTRMVNLSRGTVTRVDAVSIVKGIVQARK